MHCNLTGTVFVGMRNRNAGSRTQSIEVLVQMFWIVIITILTFLVMVSNVIRVRTDLRELYILEILVLIVKGEIID